jgi:predicted nucleotidyltransferase
MIEKLLEKIVTWANAEDAIRVMIIEGSRARRDHTVDRFSDYDLNLYVTDVTHYTGNDAWIVGKHMQSWVEAEIWQTLGGFSHVSIRKIVGGRCVP